MTELKLEISPSAVLPTAHGEFTITIFRDGDGLEHAALTMGELSDGKPVLSRIHSECLTGDVLGSLRSSARWALNSSRSALSGSDPKSRRYAASSKPNLLLRKPLQRDFMSYPR